MIEGKSSDQVLLSLEEWLKERLHPVQPDTRFITNLRTRLEETSLGGHRQRLASSFLTIALGLVMGLVIFLVGKRLMHDNIE